MKTILQKVLRAKVLIVFFWVACTGVLIYWNMGHSVKLQPDRVSEFGGTATANILFGWEPYVTTMYEERNLLFATNAWESHGRRPANMLGIGVDIHACMTTTCPTIRMALLQSFNVDYLSPDHDIQYTYEFDDELNDMGNFKEVGFLGREYPAVMSRGVVE